MNTISLNTTIRKLSTGDVVIFDETNRDLYIIPASSAGSFDEQKIKDALSVAHSLVKSGQAKHYDRSALKMLQSALAGVPVLG